MIKKNFLLSVVSSLFLISNTYGVCVYYNSVGSCEPYVADSSLLSGDDDIRITSLINDLEIFGFDGDDRIEGYWPRNIIYGGNGNDTIRAGNGDDILYGGPGNDTLFGDRPDYGTNPPPGSDKLYGGPGNDIMQGNDKSDYYFFSSDGDDHDTVQGFNPNFLDSGEWDQAILGSNVTDPRISAFDLGFKQEGNFVTFYYGAINPSSIKFYLRGSLGEFYDHYDWIRFDVDAGDQGYTSILTESLGTDTIVGTDNGEVIDLENFSQNIAYINAKKGDDYTLSGNKEERHYFAPTDGDDIILNFDITKDKLWFYINPGFVSPFSLNLNNQVGEHIVITHGTVANGNESSVTLAHKKLTDWLQFATTGQYIDQPNFGANNDIYRGSTTNRDTIVTTDNASDVFYINTREGDDYIFLGQSLDRLNFYYGHGNDIVKNFDVNNDLAYVNNVQVDPNSPAAGVTITQVQDDVVVSYINPNTNNGAASFTLENTNLNAWKAAQ